jgi:hypothetical protein
MMRRTIPRRRAAISFAPDIELLAKPEALLRVPVGLASPLWGLFAGAAISGAAWWWMTRWTRVENLEAMFGAAAKFEAAVEPKAAALAAPGVERVEAAAEPVTEAVAEAPEPLVEAAEALAEGPAALQPVGGEAASISAVAEDLTPEAALEVAAKPKKADAPKPA